MYNITAINATAPETFLTGIAQNIPEIVPLFLFAEFVIILLTGAFLSKRIIGAANIPMWLSIAGLATTTSAIVLMAIPGLINMYTVITCISVTLGSALWFILTKQTYEEG